MKDIRRGDIVYVELKQYRKSKVMAGMCPCIVVSNNRNNSTSPVLNVIPLSKKEKASPVHVTITPEDVKGRLRDVSYCLVEQVLTVDREWCESKIGLIPAGSPKMAEIDAAIRRQLSVEKNEPNVVCSGGSKNERC